MRKNFDPATFAPDERSAAKARLFEPEADEPWRGDVEGATLNTHCTLFAYGNDILGEGPQLHVHPYDEIFIIVAGNARFFVGDAIIDATAGEVVFGPAGVPHRFENLGPGRLQTIDVHPGPRWLQADINDNQTVASERPLIPETPLPSFRCHFMDPLSRRSFKEFQTTHAHHSVPEL